MAGYKPETLRKMVESVNRKLNELEKVQKSRKIGRYIYDENKQKLVYRKFDFGNVRYADSSQAYGALRARANATNPYIVYDEKTKKLRFKATLNDIKKMSDSERRKLYNDLRNFNKNKTTTKRNIDDRFIRAYTTYKENHLKSAISFQEYFKFITNSDFTRMFSMFGSSVVVDIMEKRMGVIENEHISTDVTASLLTQVFNYMLEKQNMRIINGRLPNSIIPELIKVYMEKTKQIGSSFRLDDENDMENLINEAYKRMNMEKPHIIGTPPYLNMNKIRAKMRSTDDDDRAMGVVDDDD